MKKIIQTIVTASLILVSIIGVSFIDTSITSAANPGAGTETGAGAGASAGVPGGSASGNTCGGVETAILSCGGSKDATKVEDTGIWAILLLVLNLMTGLVGLAAVGGIVYASILYTTAQDNSGQVTKAKETIFNVVLGIVLFALMYSFLQFIIPGGVFN